jgi:hypothetical protein
LLATREDEEHDDHPLLRRGESAQMKTCVAEVVQTRREMMREKTRECAVFVAKEDVFAARKKGKRPSE